MYRTGNPLADFDRWDAAQAKLERELPCCADCGNPIQQEDAVYMDEYWFCDSCLDSYRRAVLPE